MTYAQLLAEVYVLGEVEHVRLLEVLGHRLEQAVGGGGGRQQAVARRRRHGRGWAGTCEHSGYTVDLQTKVHEYLTITEKASLSLMTFALASQFHIYFPRVNACLLA